MKTQISSKKDFQWSIAAVVPHPALDAREAARDGSNSSKVSHLPVSKGSQRALVKAAG